MIGSGGGPVAAECGPTGHNLAGQNVPHWAQFSWQGKAGQGGQGGRAAAGQGRAGQGRAGQGRAGQGRAGQGRVFFFELLFPPQVPAIDERPLGPGEIRPFAHTHLQEGKMRHTRTPTISGWPCIFSGGRFSTPQTCEPRQRNIRATCTELSGHQVSSRK